MSHATISTMKKVAIPIIAAISPATSNILPTLSEKITVLKANINAATKVMVRK